MPEVVQLPLFNTKKKTDILKYEAGAWQLAVEPLKGPILFTSINTLMLASNIEKCHVPKQAVLLGLP